jgi:hypothetical protein
MKDKRIAKPRLPEEARNRLRQGAVHRNKKKYNRKRNKINLRNVKEFNSSSVFLYTTNI